MGDVANPAEVLARRPLLENVVTPRDQPRDQCGGRNNFVSPRGATSFRNFTHDDILPAYQNFFAQGEVSCGTTLCSLFVFSNEMVRVGSARHHNFVVFVQQLGRLCEGCFKVGLGSLEPVGNGFHRVGFDGQHLNVPRQSEFFHVRDEILRRGPVHFLELFLAHGGPPKRVVEVARETSGVSAHVFRERVVNPSGSTPRLLHFNAPPVHVHVGVVGILVRVHEGFLPFQPGVPLALEGCVLDMRMFHFLSPLRVLELFEHVLELFGIVEVAGAHLASERFFVVVHGGGHRLFEPVRIRPRQFGRFVPLVRL